ncbi:unnamed protein product [Rotaria sp. Silwood2]|nr:unnamed protein product [Rotaria sp. Silwood2]CAF2972479.1 unnamed protein product [Rotaria sp. Silwood2]CAF3125890.1 unnamed protein product [Rotaria sp. Silwood2]CAF4208176.1 unnamed protein product [Rotaria sp. Silwood2]CAF4454205.1 unnamed protein product [Rotaria sp. Silwood2]
MGEFSKALSLVGKAIDIREETLPQHHPDLAISYNSIGLVYGDMSEYSKGLLFLEKGLDLRQKSLPPNHPDVGESKANIERVKEKL